MSSNRPTSSKKKGASGLVLAIVIAIAAVAGGVALYMSYISQTTKVVTVCNTMKIPSTKDNKGVTGNIVATSDGVYTYNDYMQLGVGMRFDSLDGFTKLQVGKTYAVTSYGWRFGLFSWTPNIISATHSEQAPIGSCG